MIIGLVLPAAIRLSRMKLAWPCLNQPVSASAAAVLQIQHGVAFLVPVANSAADKPAAGRQLPVTFELYLSSRTSPCGTF